MVTVTKVVFIYNATSNYLFLGKMDLSIRAGPRVPPQPIWSC